VGESLAAAARREVLEETGYTVETVGLIQLDHGRFSSYPSLPWWRLAISARLTGAEPAARLDEDADAVDLALRCQSGAGLPLAACRLAPDGRLAGFFD
jgi:8-oxo-dGTP pyrophosphatase MutT (NUDIX family)